MSVVLKDLTCELPNTWSLLSFQNHTGQNEYGELMGFSTCFTFIVGKRKVRSKETTEPTNMAKGRQPEYRIPELGM